MIGKKQKILTIDDDVTILALVKAFLEKSGYECICANSGTDGLKQIIQQKPDLVLLDYMLPDIDGAKFYSELLSNPLYQDVKSVPVIILTAKQSDSSLKMQFIEGGISAYLQKPFGLQELSNVIENVFISNQIRIKNINLQHEIQQTNDYLELLFDTIPIGIISGDHRSIIQRVNSCLLQILEIDETQSVLGKNILKYELFKNQELIDGIQDVLSKGISIARESISYVSPKSNRISLNVKAVPLFTNGTVSGLIVTLKDITEAERKQRELAMLSQITYFMHGTFRLNQLLHLILTAATAGCALGFSRAMIFLIDKKGKMLECRMGVGPANQEEANRIWLELAEEDRSLPDFLRKYGLKQSKADSYFNSLVRKIKIPLNQLDDTFSKLIFEKTPVKINCKTTSYKCPAFLQELQVEEFVAVPLIAKDRVIGVVVADNHFSSRSIDDNMTDLLSIFANQAGLAIERAEAYHELEKEKNKLARAYRMLKETQERLIHAERLATVGKMAAQVAHEVRNPLVAVGGFARNILKLTETGYKNDNLKAYAGIIYDEVNRLENILKNILDFSKLSQPEICLQDINKIIDDVCVFIKIRDEVSNKRLTITQNLNRTLPQTLVDPQQIKQVLLNICENAIHSMPDGGELTISTTRRDKRFIDIQIQDTGIGIPDHVLEEMFNPFFTTKKNGIGLGLSISQQIIHSHGGKIDVVSEVGKGTTFSITLRIIDDIHQFYMNKNVPLTEQFSST